MSNKRQTLNPEVMAFKARLNFSWKEYNTLHCAYSLNSNVDAKERIFSAVYGLTNNIELKSTENTTNTAAKANNHYEPLESPLLIKNSEDARMNQVYFGNGYFVINRRD